MSLPHWDEDTILKYKGRWNALNGVPPASEEDSGDKRVDIQPQETAPKGGAEPNVPDEAQSEFMEMVQRKMEEQTEPESAGDGLSRSLQYDSLDEGLSHLLYTQPENPPTPRLIRHLDGEENRRSLYHEVYISKKKGGTRTLSVPEDPLKWVQRSLLLVLTHLFPRHKCAHGFERGKSIVTHAGQHVGRKQVYTVDIEEFFPSITRDRVFGMLKAYPIEASTPVARYLANLTTYKGALPQGAPTSPILANILCRRLDSRLFKWARQNGYTYSRYADDLTFSTNKASVPEGDRAFIDKVLLEEGFEVNEEKKRLMPNYKRQMVTGLVVNEKLNLPREKLRGIRALLHNIKEHGWQSQVDRGTLFDDGSVWREYITGQLDLSTFHKKQKAQRESHLLVNPSAQLTGVQSVDDLRRTLRGKIEFVGAVRGREDDMYQRMLNTFQDLAERLEQYRKEQSAGSDEFRERQESESSPSKETAQSIDAETVNHYKQLRDWLRDEDLSHNQLREKLGDWKDHSLEIAWFLDRTGVNTPEDKFRREALKIAYSLDTSPALTAKFFKEFNKDESFRGLLHDPSTISVSPGKLLGACRQALESHALPNGLNEDTDQLLRRCESWVEASEGAHPWNGLREEALLPYKRRIRFKVKEGEDLTERLKTTKENLEKEFGCKIIFPRRGKEFYTHIPSILPPIQILLRSMAEHTQTDRIFLEVSKEETGDFDEVIVTIRDEGSKVTGPPDLADLFSGDTRRALYSQTEEHGLRGYARWTFRAPFAGGEAYEFDVMSNDRSEVKGGISGVSHRLTFYQ